MIRKTTNSVEPAEIPPVLPNHAWREKHVLLTRFGRPISIAGSRCHASRQ
jgi:hypothetical protein